MIFWIFWRLFAALVMQFSPVGPMQVFLVLLSNGAAGRHHKCMEVDTEFQEETKCKLFFKKKKYKHEKKTKLMFAFGCGEEAE